MKNILYLSALVALAACGKSDETAPTAVLTANGVTAPAEAEAQAGGTLEVVLQLTDDEALGAYRLDLHGAGGHSHEGADAEFVLTSGGDDWAALEVADAAGVEAQITHSYAIPDHIRGHWHLLLDATDATGNEATTAYMEVHVENGIIPLFEVPYTAEPVWAAGTEQALAGTVSDPDGLISAFARLLTEDELLLTEVEIGLTEGDVSADLSSVTFSVPSDAAGSELEVELEATDAAGNACVTSFHVEVE